MLSISERTIGRLLASSQCTTLVRGDSDTFMRTIGRLLAASQYVSLFLGAISGEAGGGESDSMLYSVSTECRLWLRTSMGLLVASCGASDFGAAVYMTVLEVSLEGNAGGTSPRR